MEENSHNILLSAIKATQANTVGDFRILGKLTDLKNLTEDEIKKAEQILNILTGTSIYSAKRILEAVDTASLFGAFIT